jgi:hypothetical protein
VAELGVAGATLASGVQRQLGVATVRIVASGARKLGVASARIARPSVLLIDPGFAQTVDAFRTVELDAGIAAGTPADSWTWTQVLPDLATRAAYQALWRVPYPIAALSATSVDGVATYKAPAVRRQTVITFEIRGVTAGSPDAVATVLHTLRGHGVWTYLSSAPGAPLVPVNIRPPA